MAKAKGFNNMMGKIQEQIQEQRKEPDTQEENEVIEVVAEEPKIMEEKSKEKTPRISIKKIKRRQKKVATSIRLNDEALEILRELILSTGNKSNNIINTILEQIYDDEEEKFIINIPKQEKKQKKDTVPVTMREDIQQALKAEAELRNMTVGEYFCKLFIASQKYIN